MSAGFAAELLCDAKDYAANAGREVLSCCGVTSFSQRTLVLLPTCQDIQAVDVLTAVKLSDNVLLSGEQRDAMLMEVKPLINKSSLVDFLEPHAVHVRYPKTALTQRVHSFVPGVDAYKEVSPL